MPGVMSGPVGRPWVVYAGGFSGTVTIPTGVTSVKIVCQAAGGSGRERSPVEGAGGGGGGFAYLTRPVLSGEWGTNLTLAVGAGVLNAAGDNTTLSGTLNGAAVSVTCNGGGRGLLAQDGIGGTASGGDTNVSGFDGTNFSISPDQPGFGGSGGGNGQNFALLSSSPGNYGCGSAGALPGFATPGEPGYIRIQWS